MENKKQFIGFTAAMNGEELWINTTKDETIKMVVKNHDLRWQLYCNHVKVTIETISEEEYQDPYNGDLINQKNFEFAKEVFKKEEGRQPDMNNKEDMNFVACIEVGIRHALK